MKESVFKMLSEFELSNSIGVTVVIIGVILFIWCSTRKINSFTNINDVFKDYIEIINSSKSSFLKLLSSAVLISVGATILNPVDKNLLDSLDVSVSILLSALLAYQALMQGFDNKKENANYNITLKETNQIIYFELAVCTLILLTSFIYRFSIIGMHSTIDRIFSFIIYLFTIAVYINLFIIIKRLRKLNEYKS